MNKGSAKRTKSKGQEREPVSKAIMLNKYGLTVGAAYDEQFTLLEPNNFIPSWEAGGEEKKEVSNALRTLREKYDYYHRLVMEKERALEQLKKDVKKAGEAYENVSKDTGGGQFAKEYTMLQLGILQQKYLDQQRTKNIRNHMLDRQKKDLIALTLQINGLTESLRSKSNIFGAETQNQNSSRQEKLQSKYKLHNLMKMIDHEQKKRQERITSLQTSIQNKQDALQKRLTRAKKQQEIAELAQNQTRDVKQIKMRHSLLVNRLWSAYFKKRMSLEMAKYRDIEASFQEIRCQTNNQDVREIVAKFMTKEQTYASLLMAVVTNEQRYDELKEVNKEKHKRVRELQIANENRRKIERPADSDDEKARLQHEQQIHALMLLNDDTEKHESQYAHLSVEEQQLQAELESLMERRKNMGLINDQVGGWLKRVAAKITDQMNGQQTSFEKSTIEVLGDIVVLAKSQISQIKQKQQADEEDSVGDKDYMGDFVAQDYVEKNIRVMPMGGLPVDNQSEHTSKYYTSHMGGAATDDRDFEENKYNDDVKHDWQNRRKKIKDAKEEAERKAAEEAERLAKLKKNM